MTTHRRDAVTSTAEKTGERTRLVVVSDESVDRYNTTFSADGWETRNFEANPVLLWCHQAGEEPIGKASVIRDKGGTLKANCEFFTADLNPRADRILRMIDAGVLAVSHRFEPLEYKYNLDRESSGDGWYPPIDYLRQELLEISIVTVPGNANALPLRNFTDPEDLRLIAEAAMVRSFEPPRVEVKKLRAAAVAARAAAEPEPEPAPVPVVPAPEQEKPIDEQELEVEGLDAAGVSSLVQETVKEVMSQRSRSLELHRRGELEVA
ncbi:MAG: hypothetical protein Q8K32_31405 [Archangium sp.]|nr:hypothetical protein [Archangium sp.]